MDVNATSTTLKRNIVKNSESGQVIIKFKGCV